MTKEKVLEVLTTYADMLTAQGIKRVRNHGAVTREDQLGHAHWMCVEAAVFLQDERVEKAMRWLGFIQGTLWALGVRDIKAMKKDNMPPPEEGMHPLKGVEDTKAPDDEMGDHEPHDIPINPGIVKTVAWLNEHGFETLDSGDGETHACACDRPYPYVVMRVDPNDMAAKARLLCLLLDHVGITVLPQSETDTPCVQLTFDPADNTAFLELMHVTDKMLYPHTIEEGGKP